MRVFLGGVASVGSVGAATALTWVLWPHIQPSPAPVFFVAVMASALYGGLLAGLIATLTSSVVIAFVFMPPQLSFRVGPDGALRLIMFGIVALVTNSIAAERNRAQEQQLQLINELRAANTKIRTLSDLLPICPHCKRVRTTDTGWKPLQR